MDGSFTLCAILIISLECVEMTVLLHKQYSLHLLKPHNNLFLPFLPFVCVHLETGAKVTTFIISAPIHL